jgi:hypothetical protein
VAASFEPVDFIDWGSMRPKSLSIYRPLAYLRVKERLRKVKKMQGRAYENRRPSRAAGRGGGGEGGQAYDPPMTGHEEDSRLRGLDSSSRRSPYAYVKPKDGAGLRIAVRVRSHRLVFLCRAQLSSSRQNFHPAVGDDGLMADARAADADPSPLRLSSSLSVSLCVPLRPAPRFPVWKSRTRPRSPRWALGRWWGLPTAQKSPS